jgi:WD40 repeat protein
MRSTYFERVPSPGEEETFRQGEPLLQGFKYPVSAISIHPFLTRIAVAGGVPKEKCYIYVWDYQTRKRIKFQEPATGNVLKQVKAEPLCIAYSPDGEYLCAGFSDGQFLLLDASNVYMER